MSLSSRDHLSDSDLVRTATQRVRSEFLLTAEHLADLAAIDARQAYRAAAFSSLLDFCVRGLGLTRDEAAFRIRVARVGREFPALFDAIADGRLRPTAVVLLAPRLTGENAAGLIAAAAHLGKDELCAMLAARFPKADVPDRIVPLLAPAGPNVQEMSGEVVLELPADGAIGSLSMAATGDAAGSGSLETFALASPAAPAEAAGGLGPRTKLEPLSADSFALHGTIRRRTHERMEDAKRLLGRAVSRGDLDELLYRAFDALVRDLERSKYGITERPRASRARKSTNPRHIPAEVKRAVVKRDRGQCTFTSEDGRRCEARENLEFDHEVPVARGGTATIGNIRLRCRAHNQYEAERALGAEFMRHKRIAAREAAVQRKREKEARAQAEAEAHARGAAERARETAEREQAAAEARAKAAAVEEVIPWLRALRIGKEQARSAAEVACERIPDAPLEEKVRFALRGFARSRPVPPASSPA